MTAWMHYGLGNSISQIVDVFNYHLQMKLTRGGLVNLWQRLQDALFPWYEQIQAEALKSAVLHADETSWRVSGKTHWLWAFANHDLTYYMIDRSRANRRCFGFSPEEFEGTLVSDFWVHLRTPWSARPVRAAWFICCATCIPWSTTRKANFIGRSFPKNCGDWWAMRSCWDSKSPTCLRKTSTPVGRERFGERLDELIAATWQDAQAKRLVKRLRRHRADLFTFLDKAGVPFDNNLAERAVRPAVIIRKNSYANHSPRGANVQAVLMTLYRTLNQRGHNPLQTITQALATYIATGKLPPLPHPITSENTDVLRKFAYRRDARPAKIGRLACP